MNRRSAIRIITAISGIVSSVSVVKCRRSVRSTSNVISVELSEFQTLIAAIAETIIPRTDSPGASDAGVADCVVKLIGDCEPQEVQQSFVDWLKTVERDTEKKYRRPFVDCEYLQRAAILISYERHHEQNSLFGKIRLRVMGIGGMELMKKYTIISYCTSMEGATQALAYDYVPGVYQPCLVMGAEQKSWATN